METDETGSIQAHYPLDDKYSVHGREECFTII